MSRRYGLVDADTHVNEPPDLWTSRLPTRFRDRAPRVERFDEGDAWVLDGVADPINFGLNAAAGLPPEQVKQWMRWEDIRRGGYDPAARIVEMDQDRVDAAVLYPTPRLSHAVIASREPDFHLAQVQAYNDWLTEFSAHAPDRLGAIVLLPNRGADMALAELDRVAASPTTKGVLLGCWPNGELEFADEDEKVLAAIAERGLPAHIHVAMVDSLPTGHRAKIVGDVRWHDAPKRILQLLWSGVLDRLPELRVVIAEVDFGWVPYFKEQVDDRYMRQARGSGVSLERLPSEYIGEHFYFTYIVDSFGIRNRHSVGVDRVMWSSDFPHVGADWPNSYRRLLSDLATVPQAERDLIQWGNAQRLYRFGQ